MAFSPSQVFPGNANEPATLSLMLDGLQGIHPFDGEKPVIIMDAGIAGLDKKGTLKNVARTHERIGRLREKNSRVAQDYRIEAIADDEKKRHPY